MTGKRRLEAIWFVNERRCRALL